VAQIQVPQNPRTTFNIGLVSGGSSINTIAPEATCHIDLRSTDTSILAELETRVRYLGTRLGVAPLAVDFEVVGDRPAGAIEATHPLVRLAVEAHQAIHMHLHIPGSDRLFPCQLPCVLLHTYHKDSRIQHFVPEGSSCRLSPTQPSLCQMWPAISAGHLYWPERFLQISQDLLLWLILI